MGDSLTSLAADLRAFADARKWSSFHTPKNLAMAVAGEAGELAAVLQWHDGSSPLTETEREALADEAADVLVYLVQLADVMGIDLLESARLKMARNESRFPTV